LEKIEFDNDNVIEIYYGWKCNFMRWLYED
jgi:hypothetical protein